MVLTGKKVTIVGLARSGAGAARLLADMGADVRVTDRKSEQELSGIAGILPPSVQRYLGSHPAAIFDDADLIVVSPGVPLDIRPLADARKKGKNIIGELELAYQIVRGSAGERPAPFIAITGSNGKSTTTTLVDHMLRKGGRKTVLAGNIGNALTEELHRTMIDSKRADYDASVMGPDAFVIEVSSFQLEAIETFRPSVAAILNITPDHLDRYHSMEEYRDAKAGVFMNQRPSDFLILNADDPGTRELYETRLRGKTEAPGIVFFSREQEVEGMFLKGGCVMAKLPGLNAGSPLQLVDAADIRIKGVHNLENAMAASAMALLAGCPVQAVIDSLREFPGLEHRLELVRELGGVKYINDSKGTNVGAVLKSIESFAEPLILIAGGRDKAGDFTQLKDLVSRKVKALVLIGEAAGKIRDAIGAQTTTVMAKDLRDAVERSRGMAAAGDVVLLSPACASFDMFRDFEDRGRQFKQIVTDLEEKHA
ncbi:MAG: UDP-N-acetylmuramoyl-L-alanine--D-glutamate ligase [Nitrospirae bacterium]|nr:UDP-N-acetylmuramoyl-L-alanine--D-glutamate ligase [Nitrospirota bacterium]